MLPPEIDGRNRRLEVDLAIESVGVRESSIIYKAMMSGEESAVEEAVGALKSLNDYLDKNYA